MANLEKIEHTLKTGKEELIYDKTPVGLSIFDFWQWSQSDLLSNTTRGVFAEFIVKSAIGNDTNMIREEWNAYDLITSDGFKIEVKSAAYIQTWHQKTLSNISFKIPQTRIWNISEEKYDSNRIRKSDIFVFSILTAQDGLIINPLDLKQWEFYVISTSEINNICGNQKTISLNPIKRITKSIQYPELKYEIENTKSKIIKSRKINQILNF